MTSQVLITCEHAGNMVPPEYAKLFEGHHEVLQSHEGWDPGAWPVAQSLSQSLNVPLFGCHTTRLLIELNRSTHHPQLFSRFTQRLAEHEKAALLKEIYLPYRQKVIRAIQESTKPVQHFSMHSFTPVWSGIPREVDIGLLFDPARKQEANLCEQLLNALAEALPGLTIRHNEPYLGIDDGFTTFLRTQFEDEAYAGVEIEISQGLAGRSTHVTEALIRALRSLS